MRRREGRGLNFKGEEEYNRHGELILEEGGVNFRRGRLEAKRFSFRKSVVGLREKAMSEILLI